MSNHRLSEVGRNEALQKLNQDVSMLGYTLNNPAENEEAINRNFKLLAEKVEDIINALNDLNDDNKILAQELGDTGEKIQAIKGNI